jgi:hypothetical protein
MNVRGFREDRIDSGDRVDKGGRVERDRKASEDAPIGYRIMNRLYLFISPVIGMGGLQKCIQLEREREKDPPCPSKERDIDT